MHTQATDWEFACICQIGGAAGLGGGAFMFDFKSESAEVHEEVFFFGGGIGVGGSVGGAFAPDLSTGRVSFSPITCENPFSLNNLHNCIARITSLGASLAVGAGIMYISAGNYFNGQGGFGLSVGGVGLAGFTFMGIWEVGRLAIRSSHDEEREMMRAVRGSRRR